MRSLTIKTHSTDKREYEFFRAILTLAGSVLKHEWRIVEADPADVVIISFTSIEPYSAWDEYAGKYPPERLVAYTDESLVSGARWHLRRASSSMPRLSEVVSVLNNVGGYLSEPPPHPPTAAGTAAPEPASAPPPKTASLAESGRFHLQHYLAGTLQEAIARGQCLVCLMPGGVPVYVCPQENAVYTAADAMALSALCRAPIDSINVTRLLEEELRDEVAAMEWVKRRALSEFLWFSILTGSNGRLFPGCVEDEPVHLKEWPGHVRLSFYSMYHDIATHMAGGMASLAEIAHMSAAPLQNVIDFHNACAHFGLLAHNEEGRRLADQKNQCRERLRKELRACCGDTGYLKLVLVGSIGAGKTTALTTLSETPPILTEASPSDAVATLKATTTVAMEYGEIRLSPGAKLQIYGTPGQRRFDFMGQILCSRAWGLLILIDNTQPHPMADLKYYIDMYGGSFDSGSVAIGISHYDDRQSPSLGDYENFLVANGHRFSLGIVDTRDIQSLVALVCGIARRQAKQAGLSLAI